MKNTLRFSPIRRFIISFCFLLFPIVCFPQLYFNFEDSTLTGWEQSPDSVWEVTSNNPINGSYSLQHTFDHTEAGNDKISYPLTHLRLPEDTTIWRFKLRHAYNPSASNNWAFFLSSDQPANEMYPLGMANGYAVGVDYSGSDDLVKLWRISSGSATAILTSDINWEQKIGISQYAAIEVMRTPEGVWYLNFDTTGTFAHLFHLGSAADITFTDALYFGIYYEYSANQDQKLWVDDISIDGAFIIDTMPPEIDTVMTVSDNKLKILFNEAIPDSFLSDTSNFFVNPVFSHPDTIQILSSKEVILQFSTPFQDECWHELFVYYPLDKYGNQADTLTYPFFYYKVKPNFIVINEIMADPDPVTGLPEYEYVELLNNSIYPVNLASWKLTCGSKTVSLPTITLQPDSLLIICHKDAVYEFAQYGTVAGLFTSLTMLTNSGSKVVLKDEKDTVINQVEYSVAWYGDEIKINGGWSLEKIDPSNNCSGISNWHASLDPAGGTPGRINSTYALNIDTVAPFISSVNIISSTAVELVFSEQLEETQATDPLNYSLDFLVNPDSILFNETSVQLFFSSPFLSAVNYSLVVSNLADACGNIRTTDTAHFLYYVAQPHDIVINEIMADPEPIVGLPEYEYLELYNNCNYPVNLSNWKIAIGSKVIIIPSLELKPDSFLILCHYEAEQLLGNFGRTLGLFTSQTTLTNSGTTILLKNQMDTIIDQLTYSTSWYQDKTKESGGWSLERIDPENLCGSLSNWKASTCPSGGTPGRNNSIYKPNLDTIPPSIESVEILSNNQLLIALTDTIGWSMPDHYFITPEIGSPDSVYFTDIGIIITFLNHFEISVEYTLIIHAISDECGNTMDKDSISFIYYMPGHYEVLITEILADPDPEVGLPDAEYIELFHAGSNPFNLKGWQLEVGNTRVILPSYSFNPGSYVIICDAVDTSSFSSFGENVGVKGFPVLPNLGQSIILRDAFGSIIHAVSYSSAWYNTNYKADGGWSLEMMDVENPCGEASNWAESNNSKGGTPGHENSVVTNNPDIITPVLSRAVIKGDSSLLVYFNEPMDNTTLINNLDYSVDNRIGHPSICLPVEPHYSKIELDFGTPFLKNILYTLSVTGNMSDCAGNITNTTQEVSFAIPDSMQAQNIIINEVLFNPRGDGVDFVEIYNNTSQIFDLNRLILAKRDENTGEYANTVTVSQDPYLIFAGEYYALTTNPDKVLEQYYSTNPEGILFISNMPNLNNDEDEVVLLNKEMKVIDAFAYHEDMHYPLLTSNEGVSLERISFTGSSGDASNWHSAAENVGFATPAYENSQHLEALPESDNITIQPEVFSPDNDGYQDILNIHLALDNQGFTANVTIFDTRGREIRKIANNDLLGGYAVYYWDGTDNEGKRADIGIYLIYIELFNIKGEVEKYKKVCVVGGRFD